MSFISLQCNPIKISFAVNKNNVVCRARLFFYMAVIHFIRVFDEYRLKTPLLGIFMGSIKLYYLLHARRFIASKHGCETSTLVPCYHE